MTFDPSQLTAEGMAAVSPANLMTYHTQGRLGPVRHLKHVDYWFLELIFGDLDVLVVLLPPGAAKSTYGSHYAPAWYLGIYPDRQVMLVSYGTDFAASWGGKARDVLREVGSKVFGVSVDPKRQSEVEWAIRGTPGRMYAQGLDGQLTGKRAHLLTVDDMYKTAQDAQSEGYRNQVIDFMQGVAFGRMHNGGKMLILNYRWNLRDLQAWLIEKAESAGLKVKVLKLPAIAEEGDELGRELGEPLWPELYPLKYLEQRRKLVGPAMWAAQYQQNPVPTEGSLFQPHWWRYWGPEAMEFDEKWVSVDCALKDLRTSDYVVVQAWGRKGDQYYLVDQDRRRMDYTGTKESIKAMAGRYNPRYVFVEDSANGPAVIKALRQEVSGLIPFTPRKHGSKEDRAQAVSGLVQDGRVFIPRPVDKPWVEGFISECVSFPNGAHDDQVDACSQALARFAGSARTKEAVAEERERGPRAPAWFASLRKKPQVGMDPHFGPGLDDARLWGRQATG